MNSLKLEKYFNVIYGFGLNMLNLFSKRDFFILSGAAVEDDDDDDDDDEPVRPSPGTVTSSSASTSATSTPTENSQERLGDLLPGELGKSYFSTSHHHR